MARAVTVRILVCLLLLFMVAAAFVAADEGGNNNGQHGNNNGDNNNGQHGNNNSDNGNNGDQHGNKDGGKDNNNGGKGNNDSGDKGNNDGGKGNNDNDDKGNNDDGKGNNKGGDKGNNKGGDKGNNDGGKGNNDGGDKGNNDGGKGNNDGGEGDSPPPSTSTPPSSSPTPPPPSSSTPFSPTPPSSPTTSTPPSPTSSPTLPPPTSTDAPPPRTSSTSTPPSPSTSTPSPPPPTTSSPTPPPPNSSDSAPKRVRCKNKNYPCYGMEFKCPVGCPSQCEVDCKTCSPVCNCDRPGAVCQDPRFIGADGLTFYFHGKKFRDFCLLSDSNLHINAHFIGKRNQNMKRDFTWVQSLGILFDTHKLFIGAKKTATWEDSTDHLSLSFNGEAILLPTGDGARWSAPGVSITRSAGSNAVVIEVEGNFRIKAAAVPITDKDSRIHNYGITKEDCFAHLDLSFKFYALGEDVNGVLGQTYARNYVSRVKMGVLMPVVGGEKEFASSNIFATDCAVARFSGKVGSADSLENFEYANLNCGGGIDGRGVVCKR